MHFDLFLQKGCRSLPELERFSEEIPHLDDASFQAKLLTAWPQKPGFLGLDVEQTLAHQFAQCLQTEGARGFIIPSLYRQPTFSLTQAHALAEQEIERKRSMYRAEYASGEIRFSHETPTCWVFGAVLHPPVLIEGGGTLYANIDKIDGHSWTIEELDNLAKDAF
jgi:hypothetical protein